MILDKHCNEQTIEMSDLPISLQKQLLLSYDETELEKTERDFQQLTHARECCNSTALESMDQMILKLSQLESKHEKMSAQVMQFHHHFIKTAQHYAAMIQTLNDHIPTQQQ